MGAWSPPIQPPKSDEEYRRSKSPPYVLVAVGFLVALGMTLLAIGSLMHENWSTGFIWLVAAIAVVIGILYVGSAREKKPR